MIRKIYLVKKEFKIFNDENEEGEKLNIKDTIGKSVNNMNINFLFGAGINAGILPLARELTKTIKFIKDKMVSLENVEYKDDSSLEENINSLIRNDSNNQESNITKIAKLIRREIELAQYEAVKSGGVKKIYLDKIEVLIYVLRNFMANSNRSIYDKKLRVDIWSLNYDSLFMYLLNKSNTPYFSIDGSNKNYERLNYMIYDEMRQKKLMTLHYTKLHGGLDAPIIPSANKLGQILNIDDSDNVNYFETFIKFKEQLINFPGILFVIGYSWLDDHVNGVIKEFLKTGKKLVTFSYDRKDTENMEKLLAPNINEIINDVYEFVCYANKYVDSRKDPRDVMAELLRQCFDINELIANRDDFEKAIEKYFSSMENEKEESENE